MNCKLKGVINVNMLIGHIQYGHHGVVILYAGSAYIKHLKTNLTLM